MNQRLYLFFTFLDAKYVYFWWGIYEVRFFVLKKMKWGF